MKCLTFYDLIPKNHSFSRYLRFCDLLISARRTLLVIRFWNINESHLAMTEMKTNINGIENICSYFIKYWKTFRVQKTWGKGIDFYQYLNKNFCRLLCWILLWGTIHLEWYKYFSLLMEDIHLWTAIYLCSEIVIELSNIFRNKYCNGWIFSAIN